MRKSIADGLKKGRKVTASQRAVLAREPVLTELEMLVMHAFVELASCRLFTSSPRGAFPHRIPWTAMVTWCQWRGLEGLSAEFLMEAVAHVDSVMRQRMIDDLKKRR